MWQWLKSWWSKPIPPAAEEVLPLITLQYDMGRDVIFVRASWPHNINKIQFADAFARVLYFLQIGQFNNVICQALSNYGDISTSNVIIQKLNGMLTQRQEDFLNELVVNPEEVFRPNRSE